MYSQSLSDIVTHDVAKTCIYSQWASREILCERNYMEVGYFIVVLLLFVGTKMCSRFRCLTEWLKLTHQ